MSNHMLIRLLSPLSFPPMYISVPDPRADYQEIPMHNGDQDIKGKYIKITALFEYWVICHFLLSRFFSK